MKNNCFIYARCFCIATLTVYVSCKNEDAPVVPDTYLPEDPAEIDLKATIALSDLHQGNPGLMTDF